MCGLLLAGCTDAPLPSSPTPTSETISKTTPATRPPDRSPTPSPTEPDRPRVHRSGDPRVDVPDVVGLPLRRAAGRLTRGSVTPSWSTASRGPCGRPATVVSQRPREGRVAYLANVSLEVVVGRCALPPGLRAIGQVFRDFARGGPVPRLAERPLLLVGHEVVAVLEPSRAASPAAWQGCPSRFLYAARVCPFSATGVVGAGRVRVAAAPPAHACLHESRLLPAGLARLRTVTLTRVGDCVGGGAVQLFVDGVGRIVAADVVLPEP